LPPSADSWSIKRLLDWCQPFLTAKGIDSAKLDAEVLLAHVLGQERVYLITHSDEEVMPVLLNEFKALIQRRVEREPVSSLLGKKAFFREEYAVTKDVLTPRPESEFLVEGALKRLKDKSWVADLGTGSGCVLISILKSQPELFGLGIDISSKALKVASQNAESNGVSERSFFVNADQAKVLPTESFDVLVSNPPYVCKGDLEKLMPEVSKHDPHLALDGGDDGLDCYRSWLPEMNRVLRPQGFIGLEVGIGQQQMVKALAEGIGLAHDETVSDYSGIQRTLWFCKS
jgi:release factor glutamine methyltransferase